MDESEMDDAVKAAVAALGALLDSPEPHIRLEAAREILKYDIQKEGPRF